MGIHCEISLIQPTNGVYVPGSKVSGSIKFVVDEVTEFTRITVSLKGIASLRIDERRMMSIGGSVSMTNIPHVNEEVIVDTDIVMKGENFTMNIGSEDIPFHFKFPMNIPPSFRYIKQQGDETIHSSIIYYVGIKFDRPGFLGRTKQLIKEIQVVSGIIPVMPREPTIYVEKKTLSNIFSCKINVIHLKALIQDSVIQRGGKVRFNCEVENFTNIKINALEIRLLEVYTFLKNNRSATNVIEHVKHTESKTSSIKMGQKETFDLVIDVPPYRVSLEHSRIIFRKYFVEILANLPFPHKNFPLAIPLQIGDILEVFCEEHLVPTLMVRNVNAETGGASSSKEPPTYFEAMGEEKADLFVNFD